MLFKINSQVCYKVGCFGYTTVKETKFVGVVLYEKIYSLIIHFISVVYTFML